MIKQISQEICVLIELVLPTCVKDVILIIYIEIKYIKTNILKQIY